jgi:lysophospholipase L1-like esterase
VQIDPDGDIPTIVMQPYEVMNRVNLRSATMDLSYDTGVYVLGGQVLTGGTYASWSLVEAISINPNKDKLFLYFTTGEKNYPNMVFYDKDNQYISNQQLKTTEPLVDYNYHDTTYRGVFYDIPKNACYYRINLLTKHLSSVSCFYHIVGKDKVYMPDLKPFKDMKILNLGDSIFGNARDNNISAYLSEYSGATVYNGGLGGTLMSERVDASSPYIWFDGLHLVEALTTGDWTNQDANVNSSGISMDYYPQTLEMLKSLDMSTIDVVTIAWGTNDYTGNCTLDKITDALETIIDMFQTAYPEIRLLVCTPIWRYFSDGSDGDTKANKGGTLKEIAEAIEQTAKNKRISVLNTYQNMPLCVNTMSTYFAETSGNRTHPNAKGSALYAHLINGKLKSMF